MSDRSREDVLRANPAVPLVALPLEEAAASLGMSKKSFDRYVRPDLRLIRRGALLLAPTKELERWADENAQSALTTNGAEA